MGRRWIWGLAAVVLAILLGCSPPPPEGRCRDNRDCDALGEMCRKPAGECDALGSCIERPQICTRDYRPVCGCDGITYGNACGSLAARVSIQRTGSCEEPAPE